MEVLSLNSLIVASSLASLDKLSLVRTPWNSDRVDHVCATSLKSRRIEHSIEFPGLEVEGRMDRIVTIQRLIHEQNGKSFAPRFLFLILLQKPVV